MIFKKSKGSCITPKKIIYSTLNPWHKLRSIMRFILIFLVLAVIVVLAGGPFLVGQNVEKEYPEISFYQFLEDMMGSKVEVEEYNRSWMASNAQVKIFNGNILLKQEINHGPVLFSKQNTGLAHIHTVVDVPEEVKTSMPEELQNVNFGHADTMVNFDGSNVTDFMLPAYEIKQAEDKVMRWGEVVAQFNEDAQGDLNYHVTLPELTIKSSQDNIDFVLESAKVEGDFVDIFSNISSFSIAKLAVSNEMPVTVENFKVSSAITPVNEKVINSGVKLEFALIHILGMQWQNGSFSFDINGLDKEVATQYIELVQKAQQDPTAMAQVNSQLMGMLSKFLTASPEIVETLSVESDFGPIKFNIMINFDGSEGFMLSPAILTKIGLKIDASVPVALLETFGNPGLLAQLEMLKEKSLITLDGDMIVSAVTLENGMVNANGISMPIETLMMQ